MSSQKAYDLKITLLDTQLTNTRDITASFVMHYSELHECIQCLYGLENRHLWSFGNAEGKSSLEIVPQPEEREEDRYTEWAESTLLDAEHTLLRQYISKKVKIRYYTYDYGVCFQWKVEYKGMNELPSQTGALCTAYDGLPIVEDTPIGYQDDRRIAFVNNDKSILQKYEGYWASRSEFRRYMSSISGKLDLADINREMPRLGR